VDGNSSAWSLVGNEIDGESLDDYSDSGTSVALSADGSRVVVGAIGNDGINGTDSGHALVYSILSTNALLLCIFAYFPALKTQNTLLV
jgi:hypothetical protein